jgi:hypothetical protein
MDNQVGFVSGEIGEAAQGALDRRDSVLDSRLGAATCCKFAVGVGLLFLGLAAAPGTAMAAAPVVRTDPAAAVQSRSAVLTGHVNPGGQATQYHFEYYPELSAGCPNQSSPKNSTAVQDIGPRDNTDYYVFSENIDGLTPNTVYCDQLVASNVDGTTYGLTESFRTAAEVGPTAPVVRTDPPRDVSSRSADFYGLLNAGGQTTRFHFDYYPELSAGCADQSSPKSSTADTGFGPTDHNDWQVHIPVMLQLTPDTMYCVQLVASNASGTTTGLPQSFRTAAEGTNPPPGGSGPVVTTGPATSITSRGATLNGTINPQGSHVLGYFFYYGPSSSAWCMSGGTGQPPSQSPLSSFPYQDSSDHPVSYPVHGLERGTTYCYRLVSQGGNGSLVTFTTSPPIPATLSVHVTGVGTVTGGVVLADGSFDPSNDGRIQCGADGLHCTLDVLVDDQVILHTARAPGDDRDGQPPAFWSGACSPAVTGFPSPITGCSLKISGDTTVGAEFRPPPETTITSGPAAGSTTNDATPTFAFSSSQAGAIFECKIDAGFFAPCSSPWTLATLSQGTHTFSVRANPNNGGDPDPSPASRQFSVVDSGCEAAEAKLDRAEAALKKLQKQGAAKAKIRKAKEKVKDAKRDVAEACA